ncbi:MAG: XRE family transcriptional regulator [Candidatus Pseudobacter hemicellulosilyticus]|uniref:XRE family transcriptional regulator n=1 Tax=Candidatus Pseudobacter hemicellulosilyticus TaxID=3121375 RepID=A0AAJ5WPC8_9BACT|nr:MAG: XRE family transcriptional regulator [Pseudobacter sp.]
MKEDILIQIGNQIRERRKKKGITIQELADKASVSKGLVSQIENSRAIPSLVVLIEIIKALDIDLNAFFKDIGNEPNGKTILVKRKDDYFSFEKEHAQGFRYHRIFTRNIKHSTVDIVLLELEPKASRPMVETEAFEYKYILAGEIEYQFEHERIRLNAGDSMLFDGRIPHTPHNIGSYKAVMLVIYFFEEN